MFTLDRAQVPGTLVSVFLVIFTFLITSIVFADDELPLERQESDDDSTHQVEQRRMPSRPLSDRIISLPGTIVYFPVKVALLAIRDVGVYVERKEVVPKIVDLLTADDDSWVISPTYHPHKGAGAFYFHRNLITDNDKLRFEADLGLYERQYYEISLRRVNLYRNLIKSRWTGFYHRMPDESFYGYGTESDEQDESVYLHEQSSFDGGIELVLSDQYSLELFYGVDHNWVDDGIDEDSPGISVQYPGIPGVQEIVNMGRTEIRFNFDTRSVTSNPERGFNGFIRSGYYKSTDNTTYEFIQNEIDLTTYRHIFRKRTLAVRASAVFTETWSGSTLPFYYMPAIGHLSTIRGFERGRFTGMDRLLISIEYRYPIFWVWLRAGFDGFLFFDAGQVADNILSDFDTAQFRTATGIGVRVYTSESIVAMASIGRSRDGWKLQATLNQ